MKEELSLGARRVRASFNPSNNSAVDMLKGTAAKFIDQCNAMVSDIEDDDDDEVLRCIRLAMDHAETAAMYAVKAATAPKG
jgi:hypothetical protein